MANEQRAMTNVQSDLSGPLLIAHLTESTQGKPQPGGLPEGSRGSARGARPPGTRKRIVSTPEGCQKPHALTPSNDQLSLLLRKRCGEFLVGLEWFDDAEALSPLRG